MSTGETEGSGEKQTGGDHRDLRGQKGLLCWVFTPNQFSRNTKNNCSQQLNEWNIQRDK